MKKVFAVILAVALIVALVPTLAFAKDYDYMSEYDGEQTCCWDNILMYVPGEEEGSEVESFLGGVNGQVTVYLSDTEGVVEKGNETHFKIAGWVGFDQEIKGFGYSVDGGDAVYSEAFYVEPESGVVDAAVAFGCDYSARFKIDCNAADFTKTSVISGIVKLADDSEYIISAHSMDVEFTYKVVDPTESTEDPAATEEPAIEDCAPDIYFLFDEDEKYDAAFSNGHLMSDDGYDEDKNCEIIIVEEGGDPYLGINMSSLLDYYDDDVDLDKYKVVQFGVKVDYSVDKSGQLYYITDEDGEYSEKKMTQFSYKNTEDFQAVTFNFAKSKNWTGFLTGLRYDAFGEATKDTEIELYYIAFFETKAQAETFAAVYAEKGNEAFPVIEVPTAKPTNTPTPTPEAEATPEAADATEAPAEENPSEAPETTDEGSKEKSGCGSMLISGAAVTMLAAAVVVIRKKEG